MEGPLFTRLCQGWDGRGISPLFCFASSKVGMGQFAFYLK